MDISLFKTLIVVAKNESVTKASEEIYLTQPAVTKQIKALEQLYGIKLFERKNKKFALTEEGSILLDYAYRIVNLHDESVNMINEMEGRVMGTLKMGANLTIGIYVLPRLVKLFSDAHPDLKINLLLDNTDNIIKAVKRNEVHFGFIGPHPDDPLVADHLFYQDKMRVVVALDKGITKKILSWKELEALSYIGREKGSDIRETCEEWFQKKNIHLKTKIELNNTEAIKQCVQAGLGFSLLPWCTVRQEVESGLLRVVVAPYFEVTQDFYVSHCTGKRFSKAEKTFLEFLFGEIESKGILSAPDADES